MESIELAGWIELEGCFNFRDLGGYESRDGRRMRTGRVFRADGLQRLTASDLDRLCDTHGLDGVIDLRSHDEVDADGVGPIRERATVHHVPLFETTRAQSKPRGDSPQLPPEALANMGQLYFFMLRAARRPIAQVVRLLADASAPTVFHCAAGKDRTGVISALLLSLLDVPESTIIADYALSRKNIDSINARLRESAAYQQMMDALPDDSYDADPEAMRSFLARVRDEHGSMVGWAEDAGIDEDVRARLQAQLLA